MKIKSYEIQLKIYFPLKTTFVFMLTITEKGLVILYKYTLKTHEIVNPIWSKMT